MLIRAAQRCALNGAEACSQHANGCAGGCSPAQSTAHNRGRAVGRLLTAHSAVLTAGTGRAVAARPASLGSEGVLTARLGAWLCQSARGGILGARWGPLTVPEAQRGGAHGLAGAAHSRSLAAAARTRQGRAEQRRLGEERSRPEKPCCRPQAPLGGALVAWSTVLMDPGPARSHLSGAHGQQHAAHNGKSQGRSRPKKGSSWPLASKKEVVLRWRGL